MLILNLVVIKCSLCRGIRSGNALVFILGPSLDIVQTSGLCRDQHNGPQGNAVSANHYFFPLFSMMRSRYALPSLWFVVSSMKKSLKRVFVAYINHISSDDTLMFA